MKTDGTVTELVTTLCVALASCVLFSTKHSGIPRYIDSSALHCSYS